MIIQDLLGALARRLETGSLSLDANQLCCLKVNTLEMTLEFTERWFRSLQTHARSSCCA
ncbi:hypothetical protein [Erwinia mallotivora]|uniref:hypothetical protein n=1 Tax=Erwinia mallotivora TaxID=69222 RepID=UPI0021C15CAA|nr:hypothetical protein [Erwinia mallotivora]